MNKNTRSAQANKVVSQRNNMNSTFKSLCNNMLEDKIEFMKEIFEQYNSLS